MVIEIVSQEGDRGKEENDGYENGADPVGQLL
jgi:hypothetical protein